MREKTNVESCVFVYNRFLLTFAATEEVDIFSVAPIFFVKTKYNQVSDMIQKKCKGHQKICAVTWTSPSLLREKYFVKSVKSTGDSGDCNLNEILREINFGEWRIYESETCRLREEDNCLQSFPSSKIKIQIIWRKNRKKALQKTVLNVLVHILPNANDAKHVSKTRNNVVSHDYHYSVERKIELNSAQKVQNTESEGK